MKKNIAVLMGGYSSEWKISLKSGGVVAQHLDPAKYNIYPVAILKEGWFYTDNVGIQHAINRADFSLRIDHENIYFDAAFNTIHGTPGEDGIFQAYLSLLNIPQTSCDSYQSAITFNKRDCIAILKPWGVHIGKHVYLNQGAPYDVNEIVEKVGLPCFVKANRSGSSYGVSKVYEASEMDHALEVAFIEDDEAIIESFLSGCEVSVGVFKINGVLHALPPTEIVSENDFFDYEAKYEGKSQEITPARISNIQTKAVQEQAKRIYNLLRLKGIARADFIFHQGYPHFIEINTTPGLSEQSIVPQQILKDGFTLQEVFGILVEEAIKEKKK